MARHLGEVYRGVIPREDVKDLSIRKRRKEDREHLVIGLH
jgi:hypothetical protein